MAAPLARTLRRLESIIGSSLVAARGPRPTFGPSQQFHEYLDRYLIVPQIEQSSAAGKNPS
jgi:hypothetical protein